MIVKELNYNGDSTTILRKTKAWTVLKVTFGTVDSPNLQIGINKRKTKDKTQVRFSVSPRRGGKNDGFYAHMVEFGTSKQAPQPFMRPAFEAQGNQSIDAAKDYLAKRIDKEIQKSRR